MWYVSLFPNPVPQVWANPQAEDTADAAEDWDARGRDAQPQPHRARRNRGPRVDIISREVQPEVWVAVPVTEGCVVVPTAHEARARMMRRLDADAEEALRCEALLPSSFVQAFAFYRETVERNQSTGRAPRGFDFVYPNLNGHMNYYAIFLLFLEYGFDVRYYHAQIFKCYMAFKHVCKTADDNVKILHTILFGPPSSGKSFAMDLCKRMTPPGIALPVTHVSDQRNAVKLGNADELSCQVQIHDEANASMLGMAEASNGRQRVAQNALSSTATEYKESLTNRRPTSCVMQVTKEGGRTRELFEWNNDIVSFQLTNNFPKLAPPMMSRFNSVCFYSIPRLDVMDSKRRAMDPARERLARGFAEHQQLLYVLQLKFDTLQACGICAPVPEEGWKVLLSTKNALNAFHHLGGYLYYQTLSKAIRTHKKFPHKKSPEGMASPSQTLTIFARLKTNADPLPRALRAKMNLIRTLYTCLARSALGRGFMKSLLTNLLILRRCWRASSSACCVRASPLR